MELNWTQYSPAKEATVITTIDAHAAGEPLRIITAGLPPLPGKTMLEKRRYMQQHLDYIRHILMWEPRGHRDMYGAVMTPAVTPEVDLGILFMHNEGYSTMCGHGIIALVTTLLETGALPAKGQQTQVNLDTPAGLVQATAHLDARGCVEYVSFLNVPSFLYSQNVAIEVAGVGKVPVDIAFGGAFYAVLPAAYVGLRVMPQHQEQLITIGEAIKKAVNALMPINHPIEEDLGFLYGTIFTDSPEDSAHHSRNVCIFADGEVDRSPTGTGVSARLAIHHAKGEITDNQSIIIESILGAASTFSGRVVGHAQIGQYKAIVPEVSGRAFITGRHEFIVNPNDELGRGFFLS
ncbi:MAG: proline racemase family protein [Chloroflexi bacterium]|nr:proline racemase family protein [Chloroflexota bacterium]